MIKSSAHIKEQLVKTVVRSGNGGAVWVPKSWRGEEVVVILPQKPAASAKERVLLAMQPYLQDIVSAGMVGSHARGDQDKHSDIDALIITSNKRIAAEMKKKNVDAICLSPETARSAVSKYPLWYYQMARESRPIINGAFLEELRQVRPAKSGLKKGIVEAALSLESSKQLIDLDRLDSGTVQSASAIYSLVLRLRELYALHCILSNEPYSSKGLKAWLLSKGITSGECKSSFEVFRQVRDGRKVSPVAIETADKLIAILEKEIGHARGIL